jgi:E3 ubiquitin-protein ligase HERC2
MIPTPNNKNNHGLNRECFMINPSSLLPNHLDMFKYFGYYLGMAIRSEQALALDLAPVFWRNLLNEYEATSIKEKEADLKTFDTF